MKIDLDDLERYAVAVRDGTDDLMDDGPALAMSDPETMIALIAKIRELDAALSDCLAIAQPGSERDRLVSVLARGVTLT
jgi:hypothetical protein